MNSATTRTVVTDAIASYSTEMLIIVSAVVVVIVGFFVLRKGMSMLLNSDSRYGGSSFGVNDPMENEYQTGKRKGYWSNRDQYLND